MAAAGPTRLGAPAGLMAAPAYAHWKNAGLPAADELSAMVLARPAVYRATLPVSVHMPSRFGSQITPMRGLRMLSFAIRVPALSTPRFLSQRMPRSSVTLLARQASLKKRLCVRKFVPRLLSAIGLYCRMVDPGF